MTFCKTLKTEDTNGGYTVTAYESTEKYSNAPRYEIIVSKTESHLAFSVIAAGRTTWRKRFADIVKEYSR